MLFMKDSGCQTMRVLSIRIFQSGQFWNLFNVALWVDRSESTTLTSILIYFFWICLICNVVAFNVLQHRKDRRNRRNLVRVRTCVSPDFPAVWSDRKPLYLLVSNFVFLIFYLKLFLWIACQCVCACVHTPPVFCAPIPPARFRSPIFRLVSWWCCAAKKGIRRLSLARPIAPIWLDLWFW